MPKKTSPSKLANGYYWCKPYEGSEWHIMELGGNTWWFMGWDVPTTPPFFVGKRIKEPK